MIVEFLQIPIPTDRTSGTRTCATQMLTNTNVEICSTRLTTVPRRPLIPSLTLHSIMDDIADDALMDCVDKIDARKLKGNFSFGLDFLQETVETRFTHVSNEKDILFILCYL